MMLRNYFTALLLVWISCSPVQIKPSVTIEKKILFAKNWNVAVVDLSYEFEGEGQFGMGHYISGGKDGGRVLAGLLASELSKLDNLNLVERGMMKKVLAEHALQQSGVVDTQTMADLGRMVGADAVIAGELTDYVLWNNIGGYGSTISFSIRMIDVESGQVILSSAISRARASMDVLANAQLTAEEVVAAIRKQMTP